MKNIFYILLGVLFFSCGNREIKDNNWNPLVTLKTPVASTNPVGEYTVEYLFEYDNTSLELKAEPSSDFNSTTLTLRQNNKDSIRFSFRMLENAEEDDYSIVLTDIVSRYNGETLSKDIILKDRTLTGKDKWDIEFTEDMYDSDFEYNIPLTKLTIYIIIAVVLLILCGIIFILTRPGGIFGRPLFKGQDVIILYKGDTQEKINIKSDSKGNHELKLPLGSVTFVPRKAKDSSGKKQVFVSLRFISKLKPRLTNRNSSNIRIYTGHLLSHRDEVTLSLDPKIRIKYINPNKII
tara:strand:+ start:657 stop:1535 length:879 start_codon:yes stop_codon:yes gene_type:complete